MALQDERSYWLNKARDEKARYSQESTEYAIWGWYEGLFEHNWNGRDSFERKLYEIRGSNLRFLGCGDDKDEKRRISLSILEPMLKEIQERKIDRSL